MKTLLLSFGLLLLFPMCLTAQVLSCNPDSSRRQRITSSSIPNNYTCYMEMTRGRSERYGTGFLISPRVILTAGHNLAYFPSGKVKSVDLYFGSIDSSTYLCHTTVKLEEGKNCFYNKGYWINGKIRRDFAIIILPDSNVFQKVGGCFQYDSTLFSRTLSNIHITGSPGDKNLFEMWTDSTTSFELMETYIRYDLFTEVRNSGSPIWTRTLTGMAIVGIHSRGYGNCNAAVMLTPKVYGIIRQWCLSVDLVI